MQLSLWVLGLISVAELFLFVLILVFFLRLKRSEDLLMKLQQGQNRLLQSLKQNEELERDLVDSFSRRQEELRALDQRLEERSETLQKLLKQAENVSKSPQFLRELILTGTRQGRSPSQLAKATGLSVDEVELILAESDCLAQPR